MTYARTLRSLGFYFGRDEKGAPRSRPRLFPPGTLVSIGEVKTEKNFYSGAETLAYAVSVCDDPVWVRKMLPMRMLRPLSPLEALAAQADL